MIIGNKKLALRNQYKVKNNIIFTKLCYTRVGIKVSIALKVVSEL